MEVREPVAELLRPMTAGGSEGHVRTIRIVAVATVTMALALLIGGAASAAPYPIGASVQCDATAVAPNATVTCSASGFAGGTEVDWTLTGEREDGSVFVLDATVTADGGGTATVTFKVPSDAANGPATIEARGQDASGDFVRVAAGVFTVDDTLAAAPEAQQPPLTPDVTPRTGAEFTRGGALATLAIVVGAGLVLYARRRSRHDAETHLG